MLRQTLFALFAVVTAAAPAAAQRSFDIPGLGTIYFGGGGQRQQVDQRRLDQRFKVLDRKRNYNDESRIVFDLTNRQRQFTQLRIRAIGKVVRITNMEVIFGNGKSQQIDIYQPIQPGEVSPALDLTGDARSIRRVILTKRRTWQRERGEVELLGLPDETGGNKLIGSERHRSRSRDVEFDVGGSKGRFDNIRLRALGEPVRISTIDVTFGNGKTQSIRYYKTLTPGYMSEPLDLQGNSRGIRRVVVNKRRTYDEGRGTLQLFGLPGKAAPLRRIEPRYSVIDTQRTGRRAEDVLFNNINSRNRWDEIRIKALDRAIKIEDVVIVFGNGRRQRVDIDQRLRPGEATRAIPLDGRNARRIERIRVEVRRRRGPRGRLQVLGVGDARQVATPPPRRASQQTVPKGWVLFGSETVGTRSERQVLPIGKEAGVFDRITFRAIRNDIHIRDVTVVYGNGTRDRRDVDLLVPAGYGTPPIDLKTGRRSSGRFIREIIVTYRAKGRRWGNNTALLQVYGEYAEDWLRGRNRGASNRGKWIRLGARKAAMFSKDNDSMIVGKRYGRFRAVQVRVHKSKVKLYGMTLTYANGTTEAVPIYGKISSGGSSQPFDLKGRKRFIQRIDLKYRTKFSLRGDAIVEVWGLR